MTLNELIDSRDMAGGRYAAAVAELEAARIDLAAIEIALANGNVGRAVPTFPHAPPDYTALMHPTFSPTPERHWAERITERVNAILARLTL